jgi:hypothetical protein
MPPEAGPDWVEAEVIEVCRPDRPDHPLLRPHVVVLRERSGTRRLPMYTGSAEAIALACCLDAGEMPGPRIYQLAANLLAAAGSRITEVRITRLAAELAEEALLAVEASGRTAMSELRNLLSLLAPPAGPGAGDGSGDAALTPQPGLADVSALVGRVSALGLPVELRSSLLPGGLPPGLDLAVYRIVQEGLTNVLRHSARAPTVVRISGRLDQLVITVSDDGRGTGGYGQPGRGLLGLRERVALYGGAVDAGPRARRALSTCRG